MADWLNPTHPLLIVLVPLAAAVLIMVFGRLPWARNLVTVICSLLTAGLVYSLWPAVFGHEPIHYSYSLLVSPYSLTFRVDGLSLVVALVASFVWLAASVYAVSYMDHEKNQGRFFVFLNLTFAGTLGVPLAGDFITLLLFFEVMTIASFLLVIHNQEEESMSAGNLYLYMGIFGGLCLAVGIGILAHYFGNVEIASRLTGEEPFTAFHYAAVIFLVTGFGIKAGMAPLHIWLPRAHPVAPAPASALLSGVMIKTGAYGIIRTVNMYFTPVLDQHHDAAARAAWIHLEGIGFVLIWFGIFTMLFGAFTALLQENIKKMLACSSISQMGFIILGIGSAAYLGAEGAMGLGGAVYHILNHALFKSLLFLVAGVFAYRFGELNMYKLGGLWRKMPFTTAAALAGSFGIAGLPLFNGYISKTLLHHAVVEAARHHHLASLTVAEWLFTLASAGTVCYFMKFLYLTFFRKAPHEYHHEHPETWIMKLGMAVPALAIIFIGVSPNLVLGGFVLPGLGGFSLDPYSLKYLLKISFWTGKDLLAVLLAIGAGGIFYAAGMRTGAFKAAFPRWMSLEFAGTAIGHLGVVIWGYITLFVAASAHFCKVVVAFLLRGSFTTLQSLDYRPGRSKVYRTINISNIDFDVMLVMIIFGAILIFLFYLQFGMKAFAG